MDTPVSIPDRRGPIALRSLAVAVLLLTLLSGTVYAQATSRLGQDATPAAGGDDFPTAAAAPVDSTAFVALNVDPASEQFQTSADLSEASGLTDLFSFVTDISESDQRDVTSVFDGVGATEIGVAIPAVSTDQLDAVATAQDGDVTAVEDQDLRVILATSDPEAAFDYLTTDFPAMAGASVGSGDTTDYAGVTIESFSDSSDTMINFALVGDLIVITPTIDGIESSIDVVQGATDDVTANPHFQDVVGQLGGDSMLFSWSDSGELLSDPDYADMLTQMGIDPATAGQYNVYAGLKVSADASAPGFRVNTVSFPNDEGAATPAATPSYSSDLTDRVPDSTMIYLGGDNLGGMLGPIVSAALATSAATDLANGEVAAFPGVVTPAVIDGNGSDDTTTGNGVPAQPGDTPPSDDLTAISGVVSSFLTLLNGEYVVAIDAPNMDTLSDPNSLFALMATGVTDSAMVDNLIEFAVDSFAGDGSDLTITSEVVDGSTIYTASSDTSTTVDATSLSGTPDAVTADPSAIRFSFGVVDGQLLIGLGDSVQTYLDGPDSSLADNPQYQQTFDALGRSPSEGAVVYLDLTTLLPLVQTGGELLGGTGSFPDADPSCGDYDTQDDAQAAYDDEPFENSSLDQDFDGQACDDFFASSATPEPLLSDIDLSGSVAYGQVTYQGDGFTASDGLWLVDTAA